MAIDYEFFIRSDYNTTINNVSASNTSLLFKKINKDNTSILEDVEMQDSNYSNTSHLNSRYYGAKSTSNNYTFYTDGDNSYGKNAAIDINTTKFAWANSISPKNLNFCDKTTVNIKYLIDASGSLTELSTKNNNLFEVQSMYKHGDTLNISLLDKLNPTNQSNLEGDKIIYEGGYSYAPIVFREINERLDFSYLIPEKTTTSRLGSKVVNINSYVFRAIGNSDTNFSSPLSQNTKFLINGVEQVGLTYSYNRGFSRSWPYGSYVPLNTSGSYKRYNGTIFYDSDPEIESNSHYYTLDWFTPNVSASANGGYVTLDSIGTMKTNATGLDRYQYFQANRYSNYSVNVNIPIKISYSSNPDDGWSTFKVIGILEYQKNGDINWNYFNSTKLQIKSIPSTNGIGVDESNSSILVDDSINSGNPYIEVSCVLNDVRLNMDENDKLRLKVYFAEMRNFFNRTEDIYFEIKSGDSSTSFFEVWDFVNSGTTTVTTSSIAGSPDIFDLDADNQTIIFNDTSSLLYKKTTFVPSTNTGSISSYYSPVEDLFEFKVGDVVRFTTYNTIKADLYKIIEVTEPVTSYFGTDVILLEPLKIKLDRLINYNDVNSRTFAFLRRKDDETSIILDFKKKEGATSNGLVIPYNLDKNIKNNVSNIISPLKDKILSKILIV
jgi:hypothetical protein